MGADVVFSQLSKPHLRPSKLKNLRWLQEETNEPYALEAFEGLLEGLSGLEILHIDINNMPSLPKPAVLAHHGKTLKSLFVRSTSNSTNINMYEAPEFDLICTSCTELRQLSVTFPPIVVSHAVLDSEYKLFLVGACNGVNQNKMHRS